MTRRRESEVQRPETRGRRPRAPAAARRGPSTMERRGWGELYIYIYIYMHTLIVIVIIIIIIVERGTHGSFPMQCQRGHPGVV